MGDVWEINLADKCAQISPQNVSQSGEGGVIVGVTAGSSNNLKSRSYRITILVIQIQRPLYYIPLC